MHGRAHDQHQGEGSQCSEGGRPDEAASGADRQDDEHHFQSLEQNRLESGQAGDPLQRLASSLCDLAQLDDFTLSLLTNDEVLAINQDALGRQATQFFNHEGKVIYAKTLEDGSIAVGLFNRGEKETSIAVKWGPWGTLPTAHVGTTFRVRDLWRQQDLGDFKDSFESKVAAHGVTLIRLIPVP